MPAGTKDRAYQRLFTLFGMPGKVDTPEMWESIGKFGLGNKRSLEQYQEFIGVNLTTLEVTAGSLKRMIHTILACTHQRPNDSKAISLGWRRSSIELTRFLAETCSD